MATEDRKQWTVLVWIAGDNDLDEFGVSDINEMKSVGSGDAVDVAVQFDRMGDAHTRRYHLRPGTPLEEDEVADLGETNTGDPAVAADFFSWGIEQFPSEKVLAVIWNHGSGIDETDVYARARERGLTVERRIEPGDGAIPRERVREVVASRHRRALFSTTVDQAVQDRGIAYDDTARDFLDNAELKQVLEQVKQRTGRTIDVMGFDACLMNLVEVAYQLRGVAGHIVGSEEVEPGDGWPYDRVVREVTDSPAAEPGAVARALVQHYLESYGGERGVTQSAFDLSRADALAQAMDGLAGACISSVDTAEGRDVLGRAVKNAQRFTSKDFADLGNFCSLLGASSDAAVKEAAQAVTDALTGATPFVAAAGTKGPGVERATGAAVYFPVVGDVTVAYDRLDFAAATRWDDLIAAYQGM
jgi:Clostripain family